MSAPVQDPSQPIEPFLKKVLGSLDSCYRSATTGQAQFTNVEAYALQFGKQLKPASSVIINGKPVLPLADTIKLEFQKKWLATPLTQHQLNSYDCHLIPGSGVFVIQLSGKVRFDESGRTRLGETADMVSEQTSRPVRPLWGSWFGFDLNMVVDEFVLSNDENEVINSYNYRITYKPQDSVIDI
ncbi:uncharacterized protein KQ657_005131 [Scheffersomyces spartinae]|uniref:Uncharacterized protein n=1 Tax=Scheffersomyces spartinae TaxID=45513 RepID=A0A9P7V9P3_9ASCO|nr:uncharacterized protein KQ657_005131 [Scheffersomyces spartinae]KAG7193932.1 hypothetical protein KQ657_005131 [Scheffersomyces spartinae]